MTESKLNERSIIWTRMTLNKSVHQKTLLTTKKLRRVRKIFGYVQHEEPIKCSMREGPKR